MLASPAISVRRQPIVTIPVRYPHCQSTEAIKAGKQANGAQRSQCQNKQCARRIFLLQYRDRGRVPEIRRQIVDMAINGSGVRDTARVLRISRTTVIVVLKKAGVLQHANLALVPSCSRAGRARAQPRRAAELDEMWSFVGAKATARWLWHAVDHRAGSVLAYVVGSQKDAVFLKLRTLLAPFGVTRYYTDKADVYRRHLPPEQHTVGKLTMQKIERKHLTLRTRLKCLARKTFFFPFVRHARPPHRVIHEPSGIRPAGIKGSKYRIGTLSAKSPFQRPDRPRALS